MGLAGDDWGKTPMALVAHETTVHNFVFSENNKYLISNAIDKSIIKWDLTARDPRRTYLFLRLPVGVKFLLANDIFEHSARPVNRRCYRYGSG